MNREMIRMNELFVEIVHLASKAACTDDEQGKRQALADIYDAIASVLNVDHGLHGLTRIESEEDEEKANWLEFCRLKLVRIGAPGQETTFIGKRVNEDTENPSQIFEIKVRRKNPIFPATATCTENGELLFKLEGSTSFDKTEYSAVKALKAILDRREYQNRDRNRRRKLARAAKRAAANRTI